MLSSLSPARQQFVNSLSQISTQLQQAQQQLATGSKISQPSDDPDSISELLQLRASLSNTQQSLSNLVQTKSETDAGESALENAVTLFDQVQTLGAQGVSSTQTAAARQTISTQLNSILQQFVGITGTSANGRFIFGGDGDQAPPYSYDATQTPPVSAYQGSASTRLAQSPDGTSFPIALTAQQIFDSSDPTTNVFTSIQNLSTALNNNDTAGAQTALDGLTKVASYLNSQLSFYGNVQNQVTNATNYGQNLQTQLQSQISGLSEADSATAILDITQLNTQQQAALQSEALLRPQSLFNYLG